MHDKIDNFTDKLMNIMLNDMKTIHEVKQLFICKLNKYSHVSIPVRVYTIFYNEIINKLEDDYESKE